MTSQFAALFSVVLVISLIAAPATYAKTDGSNDMSWLDGFTLVVLDTDDISSLHNARATIQSHGGRVAIMSPPSMILGWIPFDRRAELIGQAGITAIYDTEVLPGEDGEIAVRAEQNPLAGGMQRFPELGKSWDDSASVVFRIEEGAGSPDEIVMLDDHFRRGLGPGLHMKQRSSEKGIEDPLELFRIRCAHEQHVPSERINGP